MDGSDVNNPALVCLDVVEEDVARSRSVYCDQCRVVGWSGHPVCGKRYHFIIKADGSSIGGYHKPCMCCGDILHLSESKCKSCNHVTTSDDVEDWVYQQLENTSHLLHGVIHANGYGHLLRVNGREGGSRVLSGHHIMDFWDRLCKLLGARKVSVMDVSKKFGLEYRLLHAIMKGYPWYGDWGYEFGSGSYCVTIDAYKSAVEGLSNIPLSIFLSEGSKLYPRLHEVISYYKSLSEHELVYIRDLFCFLMGLAQDTNKTSLRFHDITCKKQRTTSLLCSWTKNDIERVEQAIFRVLRAVSGPTWVSRRALKGAACKVGSPELLDYCLSELGGKVVNNGKVVSVRLNPASGAVEYRLQEGNSSSDKITTVINPPPPKEVILQDLRYLYESLLHPQTQLTCAYQALRDVAFNSAEKLLDCKQFVKDYRPEKVMSMSNTNAIYVSCEVELMDDSEEYTTNPPPELIVLPSNAALCDFKLEITKAFHDVYLMFRRFQVDELPDFIGVDDSTQVKLVLGSREVVRVRGRLLGKNGLSRFRMERGVERWTVDCSCGAKDDDGERMLACDVCGVWRHTRCSGIRDADPVPARFVCPKCRSSDLTCKPSGHCKDETMAEMLFGEGFANAS